MIIYNKTWLDNLSVTAFAEKEHEENFIPNAEFENIKSSYITGFYSPNLFIRCGLFFLTLIISSCSSGFLSLLLMETDVVTSYGWLIFLGIAHYIALEFIVRNKFHFGSGVDDAFLFTVFGLFTSAFFSEP